MVTASKVGHTLDVLASKKKELSSCLGNINMPQSMSENNFD